VPLFYQVAIFIGGAVDNKLIHQQDYWNSLSKLDPDASVIDPKDKLGFKNGYIAGIRDYYFSQYIERAGSGGVLLDFGCGTGSATLGLLKQGCQVVGLDISENLLQVARRRCDQSASVFVLIDGASIPFRAGSFSAAVDYVVLSYIIDNEKVVQLLGEIKRVLQSGASFAMIEQTRRKRIETESGLKVQRTQEEWYSIFELAGFKCVSSQVVRYGQFPFTYLIRYGCIPKLFWPMLMRFERWVGGFCGVLPFGYAEVLYEVKV